MNWPNDADGDVLRRLVKAGFDFGKVWEIDFNIDFNAWPLSNATKDAIKKLHPKSRFIEPDDEDIENGDLIGYVQLRICSKLTYDFVIETQRKLTEQMEKFGGWCESWGVMQE